MNHDVEPTWFEWHYYEQGKDSCHWTVLDYPGWKYQEETYETLESCTSFHYYYADMINGPDRNSPALKIYKNGISRK